MNTEYWKSTPELQDERGRRTTMVVRLSLTESYELLRALDAVPDKSVEVRWVYERIAKERHTLLEERSQ